MRHLVGLILFLSDDRGEQGGYPSVSHADSRETVIYFACPEGRKEDSVEKIYILRVQMFVQERSWQENTRARPRGWLKSSEKPLNENPSGATGGFERATVKPRSTS